MKVRAKAPLRLGLAGGGTDVSPFCDMYGGFILNATINSYAHCTIESLADNRITFISNDLDETYSTDLTAHIELDKQLMLHKAVYNRVVKEFNRGEPLAVKVTTWTDVPMGSGLGTSSTIVVSILSAYREFLSLPLGEYDLARLAYDIERVDCGLSGGKQDQYAAAFGGVNFMEFYDNNKVIVNPLRIKQNTLNELESRMMLFYTGMSRESAKIIDDQIKSVNTDGKQSGSSSQSLDAMFALKQGATKMKESLLQSDIDKMVEVVRESWESKKATSKSISNSHIESIVERFESVGVKALKLSGAGGGGFMLLFIEPEDRQRIIKSVSDLDGYFFRFEFTHEGESSWIV